MPFRVKFSGILGQCPLVDDLIVLHRSNIHPRNSIKSSVKGQIRKPALAI